MLLTIRPDDLIPLEPIPNLQMLSLPFLVNQTSAICDSNQQPEWGRDRRNGRGEIIKSNLLLVRGLLGGRSNRPQEPELGFLLHVPLFIKTMHGK